MVQPLEIVIQEVAETRPRKTLAVVMAVPTEKSIHPIPGEVGVLATRVGRGVQPIGPAQRHQDVRAMSDSQRGDGGTGLGDGSISHDGLATKQEWELAVQSQRGSRRVPDRRRGKSACEKKSARPIPP